MNLHEEFNMLAQEFTKKYSGSAQMQEIIPLSQSKHFPINEQHLASLHAFAATNPIYYNTYDESIGGILCRVYEGDTNRFWLNSINHAQSRAPFSPTWICSAYVSVLYAKEMGAKEIVDVGSGDGRIAFCGKVLGLDSHSIEIDDILTELQKSISKSLGVDFGSCCADAVQFDYLTLNLTSPAFFIGGLAQMGGSTLAKAILKKLLYADIGAKSYLVLAGTYSKKYPQAKLNMAGWGDLLAQYGLSPAQTVLLPTAWSFRESDYTPYLFVKLADRNPN